MRTRHLCLGMLTASALLSACRDKPEPDLDPGDDLKRIPARVGVVSPDTAGRDVEPGHRVVTRQVAVTEDGTVVLEEVDRDHDGRLDHLEPDSPPTGNPPPPPEEPVEAMDPPLTPYPH